MFDGSFRAPFDKAVRPIGVALAKLGVSPDVVTASGAVFAALCGYLIANGQFRWAALALAAASLPDAIDGAVAKAGGKVSQRGSFVDSVTDRLSDGLVFTGCVWYYLRSDTPEYALIPVALLVSSSLVSYMRAKAESLGYDAKGGLMERAERLIATGIALLIPRFFLPILCIILALTLATAAYRFAKVWTQATSDPAPSPRSTTAV